MRSPCGQLGKYKTPYMEYQVRLFPAWGLSCMMQAPHDERCQKTRNVGAQDGLKRNQQRPTNDRPCMWDSDICDHGQITCRAWKQVPRLTLLLTPNRPTSQRRKALPEHAFPSLSSFYRNSMTSIPNSKDCRLVPLLVLGVRRCINENLLLD